jgi:hypothetical protein
MKPALSIDVANNAVDHSSDRIVLYLQILIIRPLRDC